jgi:hypothetical protein
MKYLGLLSCLLFISLGVTGYGCGGKGPVEPGDGQEQIGWTKTFGTKGPDYAWKVATDGAGAIYVAGAVEPDVSSDTPDDISSGSDSSTDLGQYDCFIAKWNSKGEMEWYRIWGGPGWDWCRSVAVDGYGNVYVCGEFIATVDFDPGMGSDLKTSAGSWDAFLVKYKSDGSYQWAKTWGGEGWEEALDVALDQGGNMYVSGSVSELVDFDLGPGVDFHNTNALPDAFLVKYSPDGEYRWGKHWGGDNLDWAVGVNASITGAVYVCGAVFSTTVDYDPGPGTDIRTCAGHSDAFFSKFDDQGNLKWVRTWGGPLWDEALEVCVDESSNPYVTGFYEGIVDINPGPYSDPHGIEGVRSGYVAGFNPSGTYRWATSWRVGGDNYAYALDSDFDRHIFVTGFYTGDLIFDGSSADKSLKAVGGCDAYIVRLDLSGGVDWSRSVGGYSDDYGLGVVSDRSGYLYVCGAFQKRADLDPGPDVDVFKAKGDFDIWLAKMKISGSR